MAKRQQLSMHLSNDLRELFERCRSHIIEAKREAGLEPVTSITEVVRHALICLDEKFDAAGKRRPPRRAV